MEQIINFDHGQVYRRRDLHRVYGGQRQGGISTPRTMPFVFLFTGESGEQYGYRDGWELDGTYRYFGEGQLGDMRFVAGNKAIRDHAVNGKDLHVFQSLSKPRGAVRYLGQMVCAGYGYVPEVPDRENTLRKAIAFRLAPINSLATSIASSRVEEELLDQRDNEPRGYWSLTIEDLRRRAVAEPQYDGMPKQAMRNAYRRSEAVRIYVLRRADGICEGCGMPAPFKTREGRPYLEPHHLRRRSDGGPDNPAFVIALCPNCHRRVHYAEDGSAFNAELELRLLQVEPSPVY